MNYYQRCNQTNEILKYLLYVKINQWLCYFKNPKIVCLFVSLGFKAYQPLWVFNAKSIFIQINNFKQFSLAWVHSLIVKNISI